MVPAVRECDNSGQFSRQYHLSSKPSRLLESAFTQVITRDTVGKANIILDAGRGSSLASYCMPLDQQNGQAL